MRKENYLEVAKYAAKEAGKVHKKYFNRDIQARVKTTPFDLVTVADLEAEKTIVAVIREHFPGHNFLAEENKYEFTASEYTWVIDPLDGTNNFVSGFPIFCSSIALAKNGRVFAGAIYDPTRDELFYAQEGRGAFLNGKRIHVSSASSLSGALLITGFYYDRGKDMVQNLNKVKQFLQKNIVGIRRLGAAALDLCYVASGRASGFWEYTLSPWDFAAGKLIVEEAGGKITARHGKPVLLEKSFIVASNGKIHNAMLEILK